MKQLCIMSNKQDVICTLVTKFSEIYCDWDRTGLTSGGWGSVTYKEKTHLYLFWPNTCLKNGHVSNLHVEFLLVNFTIKEYKMIKFNKTESFKSLLFPEEDKSKK